MPTRTTSRNGSAPKPSAPEQVAPESAPEQVAPESAPEQVAPEQVAPVLDISEQVEKTDDIKRVRVFDTVAKRAPMASSNKLATVQRERYANNERGPFQLACISIGRDADTSTPSGKVENVQRIDIETLQEQIDALAAIGVYVVRDRRP